MLTNDEFQAWLTAYKSAWEECDETQIGKIFAQDVTYQETPYTPALKGVDAIQHYWQSVIVDDQSDILFEYKVWNVSDNIGVAHWRCRFTQKSSFEGVELDGIFRCVFSEQAGSPKKCTELLAWWHLRKSTLGEI